MDKHITFRGMEHNKQLEDHINQQLAKILPMLAKEKSPVSIDIVITKHPDHAHNEVMLRIQSPSYKAIAQREGAELVPLVDEAIDIVYQEIQKQKERMIDDRRRDNQKREIK